MAARPGADEAGSWALRVEELGEECPEAGTQALSGERCANAGTSGTGEGAWGWAVSSDLVTLHHHSCRPHCRHPCCITEDVEALLRVLPLGGAAGSQELSWERGSVLPLLGQLILSPASLVGGTRQDVAAQEKVVLESRPSSTKWVGWVAAVEESDGSLLCTSKSSFCLGLLHSCFQNLLILGNLCWLLPLTSCSLRLQNSELGEDWRNPGPGARWRGWEEPSRT